MKNYHRIKKIAILVGGLLWVIHFWNLTYLDNTEQVEYKQKYDGEIIIVREMWNITNSEKPPKCRVYRKPDDVEKIKALMYLWDHTFYPGGHSSDHTCGYHYQVLKYNKDKVFQNSIEINVNCDYQEIVTALENYFPNDKDSLFLCKKDVILGTNISEVHNDLEEGELLLKPEDAGYLVSNKRIGCSKVNAGYHCSNDCDSISIWNDSITSLVSNAGIESISILTEYLRKRHTLQVFVKDKKDVNKAIQVLGDTCKPFEALCIVKAENLHKAKPYYEPREW